MAAETGVGHIGFLRSRDRIVGAVSAEHKAITPVHESSRGGNLHRRAVSEERWKAISEAMRYRTTVLYPAREATLAKMSGRVPLATTVLEVPGASVTDRKGNAAERQQKLAIMTEQVTLAEKLTAQGVHGFPDGNKGRSFLKGEGIVVGILPQKK